MKSNNTDLFGRPIGGRQSFTTGEASGSRGRTRPSSEVIARVEQGDALEVLRRLADEGLQCDSCVTDPPYHLTATAKHFQKTKVGGDSKIESTAASREDSYGRLASGFLGQKWDGGDVAFRPETWEAVAGVLRPGAFLVAFGGTRTYHRLACAIEDAGFVIQDQIAYMFGTGFPKNRSTLKPALEPICLAYKPGGKRVMCTDECRVHSKVGEIFSVGLTRDKSSGWCKPNQYGEKYQKWAEEAAAAAAAAKGRWPANVVHDGSDEVLDLLPDSSSGPSREYQTQIRRETPSGFPRYDGTGGFGDEGSAARFFYTAKADSDDRLGSKHPTVKPISLMRWLVRLVTPEGGLVLDPFAGTGSTGAAALLEGVDSVLIEREDAYVADIHRKLEHFRNKRVRTLY